MSCMWPDTMWATFMWPIYMWPICSFTGPVDGCLISFCCNLITSIDNQIDIISKEPFGIDLLTQYTENIDILTRISYGTDIITIIPFDMTICIESTCGC